MKRQGFVQDVGLYIVLFFVIAVGLLAVYYVFTQINTAWQNNADLPDVSKNMVLNFKNRYVGVWDAFYFFSIVGFLIVLVVLGFALRSHPVFAMLAILLLVIFGLVAVFLTNAYNSFASSSGFSSLATEFTMMNYLAHKLPHIVIIVGVIFIIIIFAKTGNQGVSL